ncbi:MAG: NADH:ubiquinone oxidoreductase [Acidiphilium sp. 21-60-14]|nr:MAG: NADH:ubiquinone oxidoreductase [Acidiphilium sp. 21-60-14]OYV92118.1 MAG: NADH:ubiquinone oxidoreductase [Acidiphilium sp. 37-60-79]OZB38962.1 MAG: NADH:ubiquinone oxidoreductase [Acidiphilium sp. 34-60-192]
MRTALYKAHMSKSIAPTEPGQKPSLADLGGLGALFINPGLVLGTLRHGLGVGSDELGNRYFEERRPTRPDGRKRRWVVYANRARDASLVPPEWHAWLHFLTDAPLPMAARLPWQAPYRPNLTGTPGAYRPPGHDYLAAGQASAKAAYQPWTPE